jgi:hypothetical protein
MGDRANIHVEDSGNDSGVWLYTHWRGSELPDLLQMALARKVRWNDTSYLTRIIFDTMSSGYYGDEMGFGISAEVGDGEDRVLEVNVELKTVTAIVRGKVMATWSFVDYIALEQQTLDNFW